MCVCLMCVLLKPSSQFFKMLLFFSHSQELCFNNTASLHRQILNITKFRFCFWLDFELMASAVCSGSGIQRYASLLLKERKQIGCSSSSASFAKSRVLGISYSVNVHYK